MLTHREECNQENQEEEQRSSYTSVIIIRWHSCICQCQLMTAALTSAEHAEMKSVSGWNDYCNSVFTGRS